MKKLISFTGLIIFFLALVSSSCKKDEEVSLFVGTWNVRSQSMVVYLNNEKYSETIDLYDPGDMVIKIFEGGTGEHWLDGVKDQNLTWVLSGDTITVTLDDVDNTVMAMTYTVTDTRMILMIDLTDIVGSDTYVSNMTIIADREIN
jgi:hypothetical protein